MVVVCSWLSSALEVPFYRNLKRCCIDVRTAGKLNFRFTVYCTISIPMPGTQAVGLVVCDRVERAVGLLRSCRCALRMFSLMDKTEFICPGFSHILVLEAVKDEDEETLQRVKDTEDVLKCDDSICDNEKSE